ncbi:uncharacterized protein CDAR_213671 [Caerostris darwini]|uniref:EGF-like domain-containing protein n=1 Tax=Caerostris darwini TaxID=1538125 RepID=A0AAV4UPU3_9ARAC|nr:uncharacterized protein CDAR_213671 [Caerostris darwini]
MVLSGEVFSKKCLCPEGYHGGDSYPCEPNCDDDHPCQNGGTCNEGTCMCKRGTSGVFCEEIFWCKSQCKNRLTVDCVYNQEQEYFDCICKDSSLLYDYREEICKPCQCGNGTCKYVGIHDWHCDCAPGHKEFEGKCKPCECGEDGTCEFDGKGLKVCKCKPGCAPRIGICQPCGCGVLNGTEIECDTEKNTKSCHCPKGQEDVNGVCEDVDMCKDSDPCRHPSTKCVVIDGEIACQCRPGYVAKDNRVKPGQPCEDLDECVHGAGCSKNKDTKCVNLPGSYKCECLPGYEPENMKADTRDTQCKRHKDAWMPAGVVLAVVIALLAVGVAVIAIKARRG